MDNLQKNIFLKFNQLFEITLSNHIELLKCAKKLYDDFESEKLINNSSLNVQSMESIIKDLTISSSILIDITNKIKNLK